LKTGHIESLKWKQTSKNCYFRLHIYLRTNKILTHNYLYVFDNWGKIEAIKRCSKIRVRKCLPERSSRSG